MPQRQTILLLLIASLVCKHVLLAKMPRLRQNSRAFWYSVGFDVFFLALVICAFVFTGKTG